MPNFTEANRIVSGPSLLLLYIFVKGAYILEYVGSNQDADTMAAVIDVPLLFPAALAWRLLIVIGCKLSGDRLLLAENGVPGPFIDPILS